MWDVSGTDSFCMAEDITFFQTFLTYRTETLIILRL